MLGPAWELLPGTGPAGRASEHGAAASLGEGAATITFFFKLKTKEALGGKKKRKKKREKKKENDFIFLSVKLSIYVIL